MHAKAQLLEKRCRSRSEAELGVQSPLELIEQGGEVTTVLEPKARTTTS